MKWATSSIVDVVLRNNQRIIKILCVKLLFKLADSSKATHEGVKELHFVYVSNQNNEFSNFEVDVSIVRFNQLGPEQWFVRREFLQRQLSWFFRREFLQRQLYRSDPLDAAEVNPNDVILFQDNSSGSYAPTLVHSVTLPQQSFSVTCVRT